MNVFCDNNFTLLSVKYFLNKVLYENRDSANYYIFLLNDVWIKNIYLYEMKKCHNKKIFIAAQPEFEFLFSAVSEYNHVTFADYGSSLDEISSSFQKFLSRTRPCSSNNRYSTFNFFTQTEKSIISLLTTGYSIAQIAINLNKNYKTIQYHKSNIMNKIGAQNHSELVRRLKVYIALNSEKFI